MKRAEGFYFVVYRGKETVAEYLPHIEQWRLVNSVNTYVDADFSEIDEQKVERAPYLSEEGIQLEYETYKDNERGRHTFSYEQFKNIYYPNNRPA